jgi:hypothetical protein
VNLITRLLVTAVSISVLVPGTCAAADEEPAPAGWYETALTAGEIDKKLYEKRVGEILDDVNTTRATFAQLGPLEWDVAGSEGHFRHALWLLHHMKEPWNSGGVTNFRDEDPGSELFHQEGRSAAKVSVIAFKYIRGRKPFQPCGSWLPTVIQRLPLLTRSAAQARIGYAEGEVPEGAEFEGFRWGVVVLSTDAAYTRSRAQDDPQNDAPVVCPMDGAENVPTSLQREVPDIVPEALDMDGAEKRELGFPITFSFFGGQDIRAGTEVTLVKVVEVVVKSEKEEERRQPPGSRRKKKKKKKPKKEEPPKTEFVETPVECHVSSPRHAALRDNPMWNSNSIVVIPHAPLEPGTTYRAVLRAQIVDGGSPEPVEVVTTFTTAAPEK